MAPKQRVSHVTHNHDKQLAALCHIKSNILTTTQRNSKRSAATTFSRCKPTSADDKTPQAVISSDTHTPNANAAETAYRRPFESRLPTTEESHAISNAIQRIQKLKRVPGKCLN